MLVKKKNGQTVLLCDTCGKIKSFNELNSGSGSSWVFVPDSDISTEEETFRCKKCTNLVGKITPYQNVVEDLCCGIY